MTSGSFHSIPLSSITIHRDERQRRELKLIPELAASLKKNGLIHPVLVTREHVLVAGERRLAAAQFLGWTSIAAQYTDEVPESQLRILELEENVRRSDLSWQEQTKAILDYHEAQLALDPSWSKDQTAAAVNLDVSSVFKRIDVAKVMATNPEVAKMKDYSTAKNFVQRQTERRASNELKAISEVLGEFNPPRSILNVSFLDWAPAYTGPKFNLLHCDFPYGLNMEKSDQAGGARGSLGDYKDSEAIYWQLLICLADNLDRLCEKQCHIVFWFSMKYYESTIKFFKDRTDFVVDGFPLIWHKSDSLGIIPDAQRGPRRVYETALFGSRGDRKIVRAVDNAVSLPKGSGSHMSQKPEPVVSHFLKMLVDSSTRLLDPTCGSATALRAAESLGAKEVMGLEVNAEFAERANDELEASRKKEEVEDL